MIYSFISLPFWPDPDPQIYADPGRAKTCGSVRIRIRNPDLNWTSIIALNESFQPWKHPYLGIYPAGVVGPRNVLEGTLSDKKAQNWKKWFSNLSQSLALSTLFLIIIIIFIPYFTNIYTHTQKKNQGFPKYVFGQFPMRAVLQGQRTKSNKFRPKKFKKGDTTYHENRYNCPRVTRSHREQGWNFERTEKKSSCM